MFTVKQAQIEDIDVIVCMYKELYLHLMRSGLPYESDVEQIQKSLLSQIQSKLFRIFVAERDGEIVGFLSACLRRIDRRFQGRVIGVINDLYVDTNQRNNAIGTTLVCEAESWMRRNGARTVQCDIVVGNVMALDFWHRRGYVDTSISAQKSLEE